MRRAGTWLFVAIAALGVVYGLHRIVDPDVFQQVAIGRDTLARPAAFGTSPFHPGFPDHSYVADKWLSCVIVSLFDRALGPSGLAVYQCLLPALVACAWALMLRAWGATRAFTLGAVAVLAAAGAYRLEPRPEAWTYVLLALLLALLARPWPFRKVALGVALVFVLWVNLHGYFLAGLLVLGAACTAAVVRPVPALGDDRSTALKRGALLLGIALVACCVHPQGVRALLWPFQQLLELRDQAVLRSAIQELAPTTELLRGIGATHWLSLAAALAAGLVLTDSRYLSLFSILAAVPWIVVPPASLALWPYRVTAALFAAALVPLPGLVRRGELFRPALFAGMTVLALPAVRNVALIPPAAALVLASLDRERRAPRLAYGVAMALVLVSAWARVSDHLAPGTYRAPGWSGAGIGADVMPEGAAAFIARERLPGPLLDTFQNGGLLLYRLFPGRQVLLASNTSFYPASFLAEYREQVMGGDGDADRLFERFGARVAVIDHAAMEAPKLLARLARSKNWRPVFLDQAAIVFLRCDAQTGDACARLAIDPARAAEPLVARATARSPLPAWLLPRARTYPALNLGVTLRAIGQSGSALALADRLWSEAPTEELAAFSAGAAEDAGALPAAIPRLDEARTRWPDSELLRTWLARALFTRAVTGDRTTARRDAERSLELAPDQPGTLVLLARIRAEDGATDEARTLLSRALERGGEALRAQVTGDPVLAPLVR